MLTRGAALLLTGGLALTGAGTAVAPAAAAPTTAAQTTAAQTTAAPTSAALAGCTTTSGVTVVVDLSHWGRGVVTACAPGTPTSGLAALRAAGVSVTGTQRYGTAFVCRLSGLPAAAEEACVDTPPASAYWAYFHASGGAWVSSTLGASSYRPAVGSIEGWAFGAGGAPAVSPGSLAPPPPTVPPTVPPTAPPTGTSPTVPAVTTPPTTGASNGVTAVPTRAPAAGSVRAAPTTGAPPRPGSSTAPPPNGPTTAVPATPPASAGTDPGPTAGGPGSGAASTASSRPLTAEPAASTSAGSPLPTLVAAGAVLALGGAGALAARRRRRS